MVRENFISEPQGTKVPEFGQQLWSKGSPMFVVFPGDGLDNGDWIVKLILVVPT